MGLDRQGGELNLFLYASKQFARASNYILAIKNQRTLKSFLGYNKCNRFFFELFND